MQWEEILELLDQGEGQSVEFEKTIPSEDDIARELVAFSNCDGGKIIYGLDDKNKHLIGVDVDNNTFKNNIEEICKKRCKPLVNAKADIFQKGERKIVVITVPEGDEKPYRTDDICYIRDVNISRPAKEAEEKEITNPWSGKGLNKRQMRSLQMIAEHGSITTREYKEAFQISHKTALLELSMLADKKLVMPQGSGRNTRYVLTAQPE